MMNPLVMDRDGTNLLRQAMMGAPALAGLLLVAFAVVPFWVGLVVIAANIPAFIMLARPARGGDKGLSDLTGPAINPANNCSVSEACVFLVHGLESPVTGSWRIATELPDDQGFDGRFFVPEPSALLMLGAGIAAIGFARRRRKDIP